MFTTSPPTGTALWTSASWPQDRLPQRGPAADEQSIRGCTELRFDSAGQVALHRDYWDAAEELYEKLPLLGALMRALRRRLKA